MDLGNLMRRGWNLTWQNKWMYVLGFLAALGGGVGSGSNFNFSGNMNQPFDPQTTEEMEAVLAQMANFWANYGWLVILGICALVVLGIVFWLLSLIGRAGLIHAAAELDAKQPTSLREAWSVGVSKLGRMVVLSLLFALPFIVFAVLAAMVVALYFVPIFSAAAAGQAPPSDFGMSFAAIPILLGCLACVLGILGLIITFVQPFSMRGLVLRNLGVSESIGHGWRVLRENLGNILILALIFLVIGIVVGLIGVFVAGLLAAPFIVPIVLGLVRDTGLTTLNIVLAVLGALVFILVTAAISSILVAYQSTTFTLAYQDFTGVGTAEKQPEPLPM